MKKIALLLVTVTYLLPAFSKEGMWIPLLLKQLNESDMHTMGLKISAEDIYSANQPSLKDAIVIFGGGCTGEVISDQGLVLTNHHCGYGQIQSHSTVEHDYLTDGFWAMSKDQELPNPSLSVTFIQRIEDVTNAILEGVTDKMTEEERQKKLKENKKKIKEESIKDTHFEAIIKPFFNGNQFFMYITEKYTDVRLVGAPPSSIGKYGFDTDNWVWPRHTGDFSMFRIYADKDNKPAPYSKENKPYTPKRHLKINMMGTKPNDFTMVYGFPGRTQEYLPSVGVDYVINKSNPAKIHMRDVSLEIIGKAQASSKKINIQYAAKQSGISNAWKKWIGQTKGLKRVRAIQKKQELENAFLAKANENPETKAKYGNLISEYERVYKDLNQYAFGRDMLIEIYYYGPEFLRFAGRFNALLADDLTEEKRTKLLEKLKKQTTKFFKDYHAPTDQKLATAMLPLYLDYLPDNLEPQTLKKWFASSKMTSKTAAKKLFEKSIFVSEEKVMNLLDNYKISSNKKIKKDPAFVLSSDILATYSQQVKPTYTKLKKELVRIDRLYIAGLMELLPDYKKYYPDANFTLRLTYGRVEGYNPQDGVEYAHYTTLDGLIEKMDNSSKEFTVPEKLIELYKSKNYGQYADVNGDLRVAFIASNHTTGGNSGSPALDAHGRLIGLNFDRTWESTMSDIMFDPEICRNIMVDIRYVLFIVDRFAGATHLVKEMTLVFDESEPNINRKESIQTKSM